MIASVFSLAIIYIVLWLRMINDPVQYTGTDFVPFYAAAQIARNDSPSRIYDLELQQKYEENLGNFDIGTHDVRIYLNPPFVIPVVNLVIHPNFVTSLILWEFLMLFYFILGIMILSVLLRNHLSKKISIIFLSGILFFFPLYKSLVIGQNSAMLFVGGCVWLYGLITRKDWMAGIGLALMTVRPQIVLPLVLPFLFKRRKVWWWFLAGATILVIFSWIYVGTEGIIGFLKMLIISGNGTNTTTGENNMVNLIGVLIRLFPFFPVSILRWIGWGAYGSAIIYLCILWNKTPEIQGKQIGIAILLTLFTTPHLHMHDLVLWSIPLVLIFLSIKDQPRLVRKLAPLPWYLSLALLFCFFSPYLEATIPYLILVLLFLLLINPEKVLSQSLFQTKGLK